MKKNKEAIRMHSRSTTYQSLVKVDKENENLKLQKKTKSSNTDRRSTNKKETVWDRLSKIKKLSSTENISVVTKSPKDLNPVKKSSQKPLSQSSKKLLVQTFDLPNKRFTNSKETIPKISNIFRELKSEKSNDLPCEERTTYRSLSSKYSSEEMVESFKFSCEQELSFCYNDRKDEASLESEEEFTLAPLLSSRSDYYDDHSTESKNYNNETKICDAKNDKDFLKAKLELILKEKFGVNVLDKLETLAGLQKGLENESLEKRNKLLGYTDKKNQLQKIEIDVIFKNVPSLSKEIEILRALGDRLEATLKSSSFCRVEQLPVAKKSFDTVFERLEVEEKKRAILKLQVKREFIAEHYPEVFIQPIGICLSVGIIHEFCAAQKSIVDLKREAGRSFFISINCDSAKLTETTFNDLMKYPDELLRLVKPTNSQTPFNILEQDPIFFQNALKNQIKDFNILSKNQNRNNKLKPCKHFFEGRDIFYENPFNHDADKGKKWAATKTESLTKIFHSEKERECGQDYDLFKTQTIFEPIIRGKKRRRIRRLVTPMPIGYDFYPKASLIKMFLVGFVQVSVFIVFIMALSHPALRCLNIHV